jgi:hypothetical protein
MLSGTHFSPPSELPRPAAITLWLAGRRICARGAACLLVYRAKSWPAHGRKLADSRGMVVLLLVLFPILLMVDTRLAWAAMATAIALICGKRFSAPRRAAHRRIGDDASF